MLKFVDVKTKLPPCSVLLIAKCPEWNTDGYQICTYSNKEFTYYDQPNDDFTFYVEAWAILPI